MSNEKILELCDKKIQISQELEKRLSVEDLEAVRQLILIEKELLTYVLTKDQKEEIEVL